MSLQSRMRPAVWLVFSAAGVALVVTMSIVVSNRQTSHEGSFSSLAGELPAAAVPAIALPGVVTVDSDPRVDGFDQRLRALEARLAGQAASAEGGPSSLPSHLSLEQEAVAARKAHVTDVDRFSHESEDPRWAPRATQTLRSNLSDLAPALGARATSVSCRTTMCAADLEWPSFSEANRGINEMVKHAYALNCARSIFRPPPEDPSQPYRVTMYVDCEQARAGGQ